MTRSNPLRPALLLLFGAFALVTALHSLYFLGVAHADPAPGAMPDPVPLLTAAGSTGWDVFVANGPLWGGILVSFVALQTFLSRQHWLAQGRLLAALTGLAMVAAAVVNWHFSGAPSSGIMTAVVAALALVWHPTVSGAKPATATASSSTLPGGAPPTSTAAAMPSPAAPTKAPEAGRARLVVIGLLAAIGASIVLAAAGCASPAVPADLNRSAIPASLAPPADRQ